MPALLLLTAMLACKGGDDTGDTPEWSHVADNLGPALLSITGTAADDVWTVGADAGDGPLVLHWDGTTWATIDTGTTGDLWWAHLDDAALWMAGDGGRILRHDLAGGNTEEFLLDAEVTFFGVWSTADGGAWAAGGKVATAGGPALWRYADGSWSSVEIPGAAAGTTALYKLWGAADDDLWLCGTDGVLLHFDGTQWSEATSPVNRPLFTLAGLSSGEVYGVGGYGTAAVVRFDGSTWTDESPAFAPQLNGVAAANGTVVGVGRQGAVWWREGGEWAVDARPAPFLDDFHGAWLDPEGALWAVGGSIGSYPLTNGALIYGGDNPPASL